MERSRLVTGGVSIYSARLATGRILCRPSYSFPASISPISSIDIYDKSLYAAEESGNKFETELASAQCKAKTEPDVFRFACSLVDGV